MLVSSLSKKRVDIDTNVCSSVEAGNKGNARIVDHCLLDAPV
jgi:hypothetical protein